MRQGVLADLIPDNKNANKGTVRGRGILEDSLRELGAGRSVLTDKKGRLIAGNKTVEVAAAIGLNDVIFVPSDGTKLVVVQRTDIDLDTPQGRKLALADNRIGQINLDWDDDVLRGLREECATVTDKLWTEAELDSLLKLGAGPDTSPQLGALEFRVVVTCKNESDQATLLARLEGEGFECRALMS